MQTGPVAMPGLQRGRESDRSRPAVAESVIGVVSREPAMDSWQVGRSERPACRVVGSCARADLLLMPSLAKDAELVAFGVGQHDPRSIPLADVHTLCAVSDQTSHLGVLVIRPEIEVQSALGLLGLVESDEVQPRRAIRLRADLELVSRGVDDNPTKRVGPPLPQGRRIHRVDNHLFPIQGHRANLGLPGLQEQPPVCWQKPPTCLHSKRTELATPTGRSRWREGLCTYTTRPDMLVAPPMSLRRGPGRGGYWSGGCAEPGSGQALQVARLPVWSRR